MSEPVRDSDPDLKAKIIALMNENSTMTVATVRADGWPQATIVSYVHEGLDLYFAVGRASQKLANMRRDPRISIAIGRLSIGIGQIHHDRILGLSMSAHASEVTDPEEIHRIDRLVARQYLEHAAFAPRETQTAVIRATPEIISVIDLPMEPGQPELTYVEDGAIVRQ